MRSLPWIAAAAILTLALLLPSPPALDRVATLSRLPSALLDLCHAPLFAVLSLVTWNLMRARFRKRPTSGRFVVFVSLLAFGTGIELIQSRVGRSFSGHDLWSNAIGAAAGLIVAGNRRCVRIRTPRVVLAACFLAVGMLRPATILADTWRQQRAMPVLASFEDECELGRWQFRECRVGRSVQHATHGRYSLRLVTGSGTYPGAALEWPVADWTGHDELVFDAFVESPAPIDLVVKVEDVYHDHQHDDRFHRSLRLEPGKQTVRIPLSDVAEGPRARTLDLKAVTLLQFFRVRPQAVATLFLDHVRLE